MFFRFVSWLRGFRPVFRRNMLARLSAQSRLHDCELRATRERYEEAIAECKARVDNVLAKLGEIRWERDGMVRDCYRMTMTFSPGMMGRGYLDRDELAIVAQYFARKVEHEIVSSKFVVAANQNERQRRYNYF